MRSLLVSLTALMCGSALAGCGGSSRTASRTLTSSSAPSGARQCAVDEQPATAGNAAASFFGDVQQGRDPTISGGVADPFGCAYDRLCHRLQAKTSESEFRSSRAAAVSRALSADSWFGPSVYVNRGLREAHPDDATLDLKLRSTWEDAELVWDEHIDARTIVAGSERHEKWRISLVRESDGWRVCGFTPPGS